MNTIAIVDYGMGNFHSVARALRAAAPDADIRIARQAADIDSASRVVFPGQGAMPDCMGTLDASGLRQAVQRAAATKPLLGICVGEQMLFTHSEEGATPVLDIFPGQVVRFAGPGFAGYGPAAGQAPDAALLKVPHMGWNRVRQTQGHALWDGIDDQAFFYFVHSYYAVPSLSSIIVGESDYGLRFTCAVAQANIFAVQFHPEKSGDAGLHLYRNFVNWKP